MRSGRIWQVVAGFWPLGLSVLYLLNPWGRSGIVIEAIMIVAALFALLGGVPKDSRPALFLLVFYTVASIFAAVSFVHRHQLGDALWALGFLGFAAGWAYRYRRAIKAHNPDFMSQNLSQSELNHG